jgi:hypothetical protein
MQCDGKYQIRVKTDAPLCFDGVSRVITYNSSVGIEALRQGIPVISDPVNSSIGSYLIGKNYLDFDRDPLFNMVQAHQFKIGEKEKINCLISHYTSL